MYGYKGGTQVLLYLLYTLFQICQVKNASKLKKLPPYTLKQHIYVKKMKKRLDKSVNHCIIVVICFFKAR